MMLTILNTFKTLRMRTITRQFPKFFRDINLLFKINKICKIIWKFCFVPKNPGNDIKNQ